jgi:hypothetical protein
MMETEFKFVCGPRIQKMDLNRDKLTGFSFAGLLLEAGKTRASITGFVSEDSATFYQSFVPKRLWGSVFHDLFRHTVEALQNEFSVNEVIVDNKIYSDFLVMKSDGGKLDTSQIQSGADYGNWLREQNKELFES